MKDIPILFPGDIILSRTGGFLSGAIRWFQGLHGNGSRFSHALMYEGDVRGIPSVIEALWKVERSPFSKYEDQKIIIYRLKDINDQDRQSVVAHMRGLLGNKYPAWKIPLFALDNIFNTSWFTRAAPLDARVCSAAVAWAYEQWAGNTVFGSKGFRSSDPDDIDDACWNNPKYLTVYDNSGEDKK